MALTLTPETGSGDNPAANTYATLAEADAYHEGVIESSAWDDEEEPAKTKALAQAARVLESQFSWKGCRTNPGQPMTWPRRRVVVDGTTLASDAIPTQLKQAQAEIARELLAAGGFQTRPTNTGGADQLKAIDLGKGALKLEYQEQDPNAAADNGQKTVVMPYVVQLLRDFGVYQQGGDRIVRTVRG
jgi:hypothetical protein